MRFKILDEIRLFEVVFADSNILTYHLLKDPVYGESCKNKYGELKQER